VHADAIPILTDRILRHPTLVLRRQIVADLLLHLLGRGALACRLLHGRDEVDEVAAEGRDLALGQNHAMTWDGLGQVEVLEPSERLDPVLRVRIVEEWHPVDEGIPGRDDLLLGEIGEKITVRMPATQEMELNLASPFLNRRGAGHRSRRQRWLEALELLE